MAKHGCHRRGESVRYSAVMALVIIAIIGVGFLVAPVRGSDTGSVLIPQGGMTDEEAQALVDEQAKNGRITISIAPTPQIDADGNLRVNFIVPAPNQGLSERLEIMQGGNVVYESGAVDPGYMIEWASAPQVVAGPAVATVYAVSDAGADVGNPVSVEIEVVEAGEHAPAGGSTSDGGGVRAM